MTLDQRLTTAARQVAGGVRPPDVDPDEIRTRARRSQRRRVSLAVTAALMAVVAASAVLVSSPDPRTSEPVDPAPSPYRTLTVPTPEPNPFPRSMTPEEVVAHPDALLSTVAVAPDDPDTRMSVWSVSCTRSCPERTEHVSFSAVALTTDGYETTTYVRPTFEVGVDLQVSSPREGLFLLVDVSNDREWLVDIAGTGRYVARVSTPLAPEDSRLWFQCTGRWRHTWCSLDPDSGTAYEWPQEWDGSAARPDSGDRP